MKMTLILLWILLMFSCGKDPSHPCSTPDCNTAVYPKILQLVWQKPLREDGQYTTSAIADIIDIGKYIIYPYDVTTQEKLLFVNKGDTSTFRFKNPGYDNFVNLFYHPVVGVIAIGHKSVFTGHDATSMKKISQVPQGYNFGVFYTLYGDYIYGDLGYWSDYVQYFIRINVYTGAIETLKTVDRSKCPECVMIALFEPRLFPMDNGDVFLNFSVLYDKTGLPGDTSDLDQEFSVIQGTQIKKLWERWNYKKYEYWISSIEVYKNNFLYWKDSLYFINPYTDSVLWAKKPKAGQYGFYSKGAGRVRLGNIIYFFSEGNLMGLNADDGSIVFDSGFLASQDLMSKMTYFEGVFYFGAAERGYSYLFGYRLADRKMVVKMRSPNAGKPPYYDDAIFDQRQLIIDPATRLAYIHDGFFAQCYKIPEDL